MRRPHLEFRRPPLRELFDRHEGRLVHKVDHYFPIYERHLSRFRGTKPRVLEIGVAQGGSLELWHQYFGRGTETIGLDIEPRSASLAGRRRKIYVGDQGDPQFLERVAVECGPFDVVIDDGSHMPAHQILALEFFWEHLSPNGVLLVEDLCTNYWPTNYGGGYGLPHTFMERIKPMVDDLNAFNSREDHFRASHWTSTVTGMHVYDSVVVFERGEHRPLTTSMAGRPSFDTVNGQPVDQAIPADHQARIAAMSTPAAKAKRAVRHPSAALRTLRRQVARHLPGR
ncbi:MAG: class I SAM-dependent methyltransferase [Ilumatobacter sp.]|uniref:class I SAM-dependent methyltransferase n=1 Tax=Ilumatobacter sp. TaxID=1967498 RepID=UPI00391C4588